MNIEKEYYLNSEGKLERVDGIEWKGWLFAAFAVITAGLTMLM